MEVAMYDFLDAKPIGVEEAKKKILSGWEICEFSSFYRGGAVYRHAIVSREGETRVISDLTWGSLSVWLGKKGTGSTPL